jgi:uncharacterized RDD family membrane protein YckC
VRALNSEAVDRALERAVALRAPMLELNADEIAQMVKRALDSEAGDRVWDEVLASDQVQLLVERIATAPEIRGAIAAQSAGLITDIGVRLTKLTEALDDTMERVVREQGQDELETDQAGLATRLVAAAIDLGLLFALYSLASGVLASVISFVFGQHLSSAGAIVLGVIGFLVAGAIFSAFWALVGQTPGMRFLSIRLTHHGSRDITLGLAIRRFLGDRQRHPLGVGIPRRVARSLTTRLARPPDRHRGRVRHRSTGRALGRPRASTRRAQTRQLVGGGACCARPSAVTPRLRMPPGESSAPPR